MTIDEMTVADLPDMQVVSLLSLGLLPAETIGGKGDEALAGCQWSDEDFASLTSDLRCPVVEPDSGPLSFRRVMDLGAAEVEQLEGKTFLDILSSDAAARWQLETLKRYGNLLTAEVFPRATQVTGYCMLAFATASLHVHHGVEIPTSKKDVLTAVLKTLSESRVLDKGLKSHTTAISQRLAEK